MFKSLFFSIKPVGFLPAIIGGGLALAGSIYGSRKSTKSSNDAATLNYQQSQDYAKNKIRWAVEDGKRVGLSPLASIGAPSSTYLPTNTGTDYGDYGMSQIGQNISRAVSTKLSEKERENYAEDRYYTSQKREQDLTMGNLQIQKMQRELINQPPNPAQIKTTKDKMGIQNTSKMQQYRVSDKGRIHKLLADQVSDSLENDWMAKIKYFAEQIKIDSVAQGKFIFEKFKQKVNPEDRRFQMLQLKQKYTIAEALNKQYGTNIDTKHIGYSFLNNQFFVKNKYLHMFE